MLQRIFSILLTAALLFISTYTTTLAAVSYLGPAGTYTEEAAVKYFGDTHRLVACTTVAAALEEVLQGNTSYAVVPVENTIGGPVYPYIDLVMTQKQLTIVGEVVLPIRQTLLALPGTELADIKTVLSHPQGIAQSRAWLKTNLPDVEIIEVSSTAEGARKVAEIQDLSVAAIAASRTALVYNLDILANDLQYSNSNVTRFWVVSAGNAAPAGGKASLLINGDIQKLPLLLADLNHYGLTVVTLHDRPAKTVFGKYIYLLEVTAQTPTALTKSLLSLIKKHQQNFTITTLGIYPQAAN